MKLRVNRQTIDAMLPDIPQDFDEQMRGFLAHLPQERKDTVVKKKISAGLVLAILLLTIALGAIAAALLGGKEFVDQIMAPMASEDNAEKWTGEQMDEIVRLASENGLEINDDIRARLEQEDGEYKEELMRAFVKLELGFYPAQWSLEDQAWYDEMLFSCGLAEQRTRFLPEGDEITEAQALSIAQAYIRDTYGEEADLSDETLFTRYTQYMLSVDEAGNPGRLWDIEYESKSLAGNKYYLALTPEGKVESERFIPGISVEGERVSKPHEVLDAYELQYQGIFNWTPEIWVAFHADLTAAAKVHGTGEFRSIARLLMQQYAMPGADDLTREEAVALAVEALEARGMIEKGGAQTEHSNAFFLKDMDANVWKITVFSEDNSPLWVELDGRTGEVRGAGDYQDVEKSSWTDHMVLDSVLKQPIPGYDPPSENGVG